MQMINYSLNSIDQNFTIEHPQKHEFLCFLHHRCLFVEQLQYGRDIRFADIPQEDQREHLQQV